MSLIVDDIFEVLAKDTEGKKFEKVSRLRCRGNYHEYELTIDINCAIYALEEGDKFTLGLADSLYKQGQGSGVEEGVFDQVRTGMRRSHCCYHGYYYYYYYYSL